MKSARHDRQLSLPPAEVLKADGQSTPRPEIGPTSELPELSSLDMAKAAIGRAVERGIGRASFKEFGDTSHVRRVCDGEVSEPLARVWQRPSHRREFLRELLESSDLYDVEVKFRERRRA